MSESRVEESELDSVVDSDAHEDSVVSDERSDRTALAAQLDILREENRRLREEYVRARQESYQRTALGLFVVGAVAIGAGVLFPESRTILFTLGATGLFGAILTNYLTPERFTPVSVSEAIYDAFANNGEALLADLGLGNPVYVPRETTDDIRLFAPQAEADGPEGPSIPDGEDLDLGIVVTENTRGIALIPTGDALFGEFEQSLTSPLATSPSALAQQLGDGLVQQFELVDGIQVDASHNRVTLGISGSKYGDVDRFDHLIRSFLATGFARGFGVPTETSVADTEGRSDLAVTVRPAREEDRFESH